MTTSFEINKRRYIGYTANDLLEDTYFRMSIKQPSRDSDAFWSTLIDENIISRTDFDTARAIMRGLLQEDLQLSNLELVALHDKILGVAQQNNLGKKKIFRFPFGAAIAAVVCLTLLSSVLVYLFKTGSGGINTSSTDIELAAMMLKPSEPVAEITILRDAQDEITIKEQNASIEYSEDGVLKGHDSDNMGAEEPRSEVYNQLIVPLGKRSQLTLGDGSKLWVNAGTRVVYPTKFIGNERNIYVDGEIYIDVFPDKERPFTIKTSNMDVQVLGTSFVVKAYKEDAEQEVVLVHGSVKVKLSGEQTVKLVPNERLLLSDNQTKVTTVNTDYYTSWKDGRYLYKDEKLGTILDRLSRYYGKKVVYDATVNDLQCTGRLNLKNDMIDIIKGLEAILPIRYDLENDVITIYYTNN